jgi:hypothetical protein
MVEKEKTDFLLSKWYMDCIDAGGNTFIGYSAILKWKKIRLNYANIIHYDSISRPTGHTTLRKLPEPILMNKQLMWNPAKLPAQGTWDRIDAPIRRTLLNTSGGVIRWECFQPKSKARILTNNNKILTGLGYAEKLNITIKPWEFPFNELRWGRYLSEENTIIWISWKGDINSNLLFHNGRPIEDTIITDEQISIKQGEFLLTFSDKVVLRKGPISTALSNIPNLIGVFPHKILNSYECKWRSKGILKKGNKETNNGWVIHEVIQWH